MHIEFLELFASWAEVLAWVELVRAVSHELADSSGHSETAIRVDVNLANSRAGSLAELLLRDSDRVFQSATVGVDSLDILLWNRRRAVENDRESREFLLDFVEDVEAEWRWNEVTVSVACALCRSEFECTVRSTDGDSERVNASAFNELDNILWTSVVGFLSAYIILDTSEDAKLALNTYVVLVSVLNDAASEFDVLVERFA